MEKKKKKKIVVANPKLNSSKGFKDGKGAIMSAMP